jgi:hypothetical protein
LAASLATASQYRLRELRGGLVTPIAVAVRLLVSADDARALAVAADPVL